MSNNQGDRRKVQVYWLVACMVASLATSLILLVETFQRRARIQEFDQRISKLRQQVDELEAKLKNRSKAEDSDEVAVRRWDQGENMRDPHLPADSS